MDKTFRQLTEGNGAKEGIPMVRTVLPALGGFRCIYCSPDGNFLGEVTISSTGPEVGRALLNDMQAFMPDFLAQQARMQAAVRQQ